MCSKSDLVGTLCSVAHFFESIKEQSSDAFRAEHRFRDYDARSAPLGQHQVKLVLEPPVIFH